MAAEQREFDIVVWGATGFTGRLVAEYLLEVYGTDSFRWALGGRSQRKLEEVRRELGADLPLLLGDAGDAASMRSLAERTRVVCTTVGPYSLYGSNLVSGCAKSGTHYCDLTGEIHWMRRMIDAHQDAAAASGARIVFSCGFDSIPSDLGVFFVQREMNARHGVPSPHVKGRVEAFTGTFSGGTIATMLNMLEEAGRDPEVMRLNNDPYALNPEGQRSGPDRRDPLLPAWDEDFGQWTTPFVMAALNAKVVRRSNALLGYGYGTDFRYDESLLMGPGPLGFAKAVGAAAGTGAGLAAMLLPPVRRLAARWLPAPGAGPTPEQRERGFWDLRLLAVHPDDPAKNLSARLTGDRDPGYGSTSKMLGESAVCLLQDSLSSAGGMLTPAAAMGLPLLARLQKSAGVTAEIEEGSAAAG